MNVYACWQRFVSNDSSVFLAGKPRIKSHQSYSYQTNLCKSFVWYSCMGNAADVSHIMHLDFPVPFFSLSIRTCFLPDLLKLTITKKIIGRIFEIAVLNSVRRLALFHYIVDLLLYVVYCFKIIIIFYLRQYSSIVYILYSYKQFMPRNGWIALFLKQSY